MEFYDALSYALLTDSKYESYEQSWNEYIIEMQFLKQAVT